MNRGLTLIVLFDDSTILQKIQFLQKKCRSRIIIYAIHKIRHENVRPEQIENKKFFYLSYIWDSCLDFFEDPKLSI